MSRWSSGSFQRVVGIRRRNHRWCSSSSVWFGFLSFLKFLHDPRRCLGLHGLQTPRGSCNFERVLKRCVIVLELSVWIRKWFTEDECRCSFENVEFIEEMWVWILKIHMWLKLYVSNSLRVSVWIRKWVIRDTGLLQSICEESECVNLWVGNWRCRATTVHVYMWATTCVYMMWARFPKK